MNSEQSTYTGFQFEWEGYPATAIINADLKAVDKSQYPHSVFILLQPDHYLENGHPTEEEYDFLNDIEKKIIHYLETTTQSVHVGHITLYRGREIIFYTQDTERVESFLEVFLPTTEREHSWEITSDAAWENVSPFYDQL